MAKKKRKKRTIQDVIEDIRELHEKEEDLLTELEEKTDIDEGEE
jgi:predicted KAP-like P-loop ATPase